MVVVVDPGPQGQSGVFDGSVVSDPGELLLEGLDEALAEAVLLGRVGRDVFLGEAVVGDNRSVSARAEDQAVVVAQEHGDSRSSRAPGSSACGGALGRMGKWRRIPRQGMVTIRPSRWKRNPADASRRTDNRPTGRQPFC